MKFKTEKEYSAACEKAWYLYHKTACNQSQVAKHIGVSLNTVWSMIQLDQKHRERLDRIKKAEEKWEKSESGKRFKKLKMEQIMSGCPMHDEDHCMLRITTRLASCSREPQFQNTLCKPDNCPIIYLKESKVI